MAHLSVFTDSLILEKEKFFVALVHNYVIRPGKLDESIN